MSDAHQPYTESQKDMIQRFNAAIREGPSELAAPTGLAACVAQWRDIQKRKRDFALEAKHRGQDIAANIAMQVSNTYGYCADRLEHEMAANADISDRAGNDGRA